MLIIYIHSYDTKYSYLIQIICLIAQLPGVVEYTDCTSAEWWDPLTSVLDMTLNNLMVKFQ